MAMLHTARPVPESYGMQVTQSYPPPTEPAGAPPAVIPAATPPVESGGERFLRHGRRVRLYVWSVLLLAMVVILIALVAANTEQVHLSWVVGSGSASLVWIIVGSAIAGWLIGVATSIVFRSRTRTPRR